MIEIPLRAKNDDEFSELKRWEKDVVVYAVLFQTDNQTAFLRFNPHYAVQLPSKEVTKFGLSDAGKKESRQFWSYPKIKSYRQSYKQTLREYLGRAQEDESEDSAGLEISDKRKDKALKSLLNRSMKLVEGHAEVDADTLKIAAEIFKKVGLLKDEEVQEVKPIRILPALCKSGCRYRLFCESHIADGDMIDDCEYCKARKFAEEMGFDYDPTTLLELPQDVIDKIESENDTKLIDIINNKIDN